MGSIISGRADGLVLSIDDHTIIAMTTFRFRFMELPRKTFNLKIVTVSTFSLDEHSLDELARITPPPPRVGIWIVSSTPSWYSLIVFLVLQISQQLLVFSFTFAPNIETE